ncbi:MAG: hypothetical protein ACYC28_13965 [Longimicrobiales bacterium]
MSEWTYVNVAYALTWITFAVYALSLHRRRQQAKQQAAEITTERKHS